MALCEYCRTNEETECILIQRFKYEAQVILDLADRLKSIPGADFDEIDQTAGEEISKLKSLIHPDKLIYNCKEFK